MRHSISQLLIKQDGKVIKWTCHVIYMLVHKSIFQSLVGTSFGFLRKILWKMFSSNGQEQKSGTGSVCLNYAAKLILVFAKHCNFLALSKHTVIMSALNMLLIFIAINVIKQNRYWFVMKLHLFSMLTTANDWA